MSEGIVVPLKIEGGAETNQTLDKFAEGMERAGQKIHDAGNFAKAAATSWNEIEAGVNLASAALNRIVGLIDGIAALATEQQRLSEASARLGLDFDEAAASSARFVDETEAMAAASHLAEVGIRLTQTELNTLTQRASIVSQRLGVDMPTAFNTLTTAIESGSARALRPLGTDMVALAGGTHTARERLDELVASTHNLAPATEDAASSMARLRDTIGDAQRTMASAAANQFVAMIAAEQELTRATRGTADSTTEMTHSLQRAGEIAGEVAMGVVHAAQMIANGVAAAALAPVTLMATVGRALNEVRRGNFQAAQDMLTGFGSTGLLGQYANAAGAAGDSLYNVASGETGDRARALLRENEARLAAERERNSRNAGGGNVRESSGGGSHRQQRAAFTHRGDAPWSDQTEEVFNRSFGDSTSDYRSDDDILNSSPALTAARGKADARQSGQDSDAANRRGRETTEREHSKAQQRAAQEAETAASLTTRLGNLAKGYGDTMTHLRDTVVGAYSDMTNALGEHLSAWVLGKETLAEAAQGVLRDTLESISKRAAMHAAEEAAAALASLAVWDIRGAGLHAAAAAGYGVLAGASGLGAQALAETPKTPASGSGAPKSAANVSPKGSKDGGGGSTVMNVYFGGPVIGPGGSQQAARDLASILNAGARQGNVQLVPQLMPGGR